MMESVFMLGIAYDAGREAIEATGANTAERRQARVSVYHGAGGRRRRACVLVRF